jgi:transmembrane sensor
MKKIVEFPDRSVLAEEAAEWLIRLDADTPPTDDDLRALGGWLRRSPAHREELERQATLWGRMNVLTELAVPLGKPGRIPLRTVHDHHAGPERGRRLQRLYATVAAAVGLAAIATGVMLLRSPGTEPQLHTNGLYATAVGQRQTAALADGSEIILNTNSQIRVDYGSQYRHVWLLQGEALFTVTEDADRPFRVYAGNGRIEALGTAFSVYLDGEDVNVTVAEGRVSLASVNPSRSNLEQPSASIQGRRESGASGADLDLIESLGTLSAGQIAIIRKAAGDTTDLSPMLEMVEPVEPAELAERLAWREGILMFSGDTLEDVVNEVSRYTTVSIEIEDAAIRKMRIGGRFPVGETETMLAALETNFNLRATRLSHNRVVLSTADE